MVQKELKISGVSPRSPRAALGALDDTTGALISILKTTGNRLNKACFFQSPLKDRVF
ncbi:hypothetical protein Nmel_008917 [Mimus melanotis]